jgi:hypothetical protein
LSGEEAAVACTPTIDYWLEKINPAFGRKLISEASPGDFPSGGSGEPGAAA